MNRFGKLFIAVVIIIVAATVLGILHTKPAQQVEEPPHETTAVPLDRSDNDSQPTAETDEKLDYSKPVFTDDHATVCPVSLLHSIDANHGPEQVLEMFMSFLGRSEKEKELGCTELVGGIPVTVSRVGDGPLIYISLPGDGVPTLITVESELTNKVPGQSEAEKEYLATPHINLNPPTYVPSSNTSPGHLLLNMPSPTPILEGSVVAASDIGGSGAIICPNADDFAGWIDTTAKAPHQNPDIDIGAFLKPYGCSYLPPGTPMVSEGGNSVGSLVIVETKLSDGTMLKGVTFPNMIAQDQQQGRANQQQQQQQTDMTRPLYTRNDALVCPSWEALLYATAAKEGGWRAGAQLAGVNNPVPSTQIGQSVSAEYYGCSTYRDGTPVTLDAEKPPSGFDIKTNIGWLDPDNLRN
jgi:hypothetical protein